MLVTWKFFGPEAQPFFGPCPRLLARLGTPYLHEMIPIHIPLLLPPHNRNTSSMCACLQIYIIGLIYIPFVRVLKVEKPTDMDSQYLLNDSTMPDLLYHLPYTELTFQTYRDLASSSSSPSCSASIDIPCRQYIQPAAIVAQIEDIFGLILDSILTRDKHLTIQLKPKPKKSTGSGQNEDFDISKEPRLRTIKFPTKSAAEARRFSTCNWRVGGSMLT